MLQQFPGRFLEEIDRIDWGRHMRALRARRVEYIEERRLAGINDEAKLTPAEWKLIEAHDNLLADIDNGER